MKTEKKFIINLWISVLGFSLSSITICFISVLKMLPYESRQKTSYFIAAVFWLTLITGIVFLKRADKLRKMTHTKTDIISQSKCGAISFWQNKEGRIADIISLVFLIVVIVFSVIKLKSNLAGIILAGIMFLSFDIRSFLNGKNYKCYKLLKGKGI